MPVIGIPVDELLRAPRRGDRAARSCEHLLHRFGCDVEG